MATPGKTRRYLPASNLAEIAADGTATLTLEQNKGGVFVPSGVMVFYSTGLEGCQIEFKLRDGFSITLSPIFVGDIGSLRGGDAPAKIFALDGLVLPSGDATEWTIYANGTVVPLGGISVVLVGDYSADGG